MMGILLAVTLSVGSGDSLLFGTTSAPALEQSPASPDRAFIADSETDPGVFPLRIATGQSLALVTPSYGLAGNLNCTESAPFNTPRIGGFWLEPSGPTRGWIYTSSCELAVPFNYATGAGVTISYAGASRTAVPTRQTLSGSFTRYQNGGGGAAITSFKTNFTSAVVRVGNRLVVATSNIQQTGSSPVYNPGTVLFFTLDDSGTTPALAPASPFFALTSDPNPIALTVLPGGRVAVTNAGIFDASFPPQVTGQGSIDIVDPPTGSLVGSIPLGAANPSDALALDPTGSVGVTGSTTFRRMYAVDLRGVQSLPVANVDARLQRPSCNDLAGPSAGGVPCLRSRAIRGGANGIVLPPPPGSSGVFSYVPTVRFAPTGDFAVATSFNDGGLALAAFDPRNLARSHPLLASRFGAPETLAATGPAGVIGQECCPGPLLLRATGSAGLTTTDALFVTASPSGFVVRGHLGGSLSSAGADSDGDGVEDALDVCPLTADPGQADSGGVGTSAPPDGVGDACQCGDVSDDGHVDVADVMALRDFLSRPSQPLAAPQKCNVGSLAGGACDVLEAALLRRGLAGLAPGIGFGCELQ
jgi:thrombospondin type 3 repeat protein